jgi:hypothetical protein
LIPVFQINHKTQSWKSRKKVSSTSKFDFGPSEVPLRLHQTDEAQEFIYVDQEEKQAITSLSIIGVPCPLNVLSDIWLACRPNIAVFVHLLRSLLLYPKLRTIPFVLKTICYNIHTGILITCVIFLVKSSIAQNQSVIVALALHVAS